MADKNMITSESRQAIPGRNCYHQRMRELDEEHRDLMTSQRVNISLKKIAVESDDPAVILENFEQRYIQEEQSESVACLFWQ